MSRIRGVIFDIDGTLVDSNDEHARAWVEAMAKQGHSVPFEKVRPLIGMGGDKVLPQTLGIAKDSEEGKRIGQSRKEFFKSRYLPDLKATPGAEALLERLYKQGLKMVIATSAEPDELQDLLRVISSRAPQFFAEQISAHEAKHSKPDPDVVAIAVQRSGCQPQELIMLGDTPYDIEAATKENVKTIAFRCGGWHDQELKGAIAVYNDPADLLAHYDTSVFVTEV